LAIILHGVNYQSQKVTFDISNYSLIITRLIYDIIGGALEFYFLISSYLLYSKERKFTDNLKRKLHSLVLPYFLWNLIMVLFLFITQSLPFTRKYYATLIIREFSLGDWIGAFIGYFGRFNTYPTYAPILGPFWFIRDLFLLNLLSIPIKKLVDACPVGILILTFVLWICGINLYIIHNFALFFFVLGYFIVKFKIDIRFIDKIKINELVIILFAITLVRIIFGINKVGGINALEWIGVFVSIAALLKLSHYLIGNAIIYKKLFDLEKYSFFLYATHMYLIQIVEKLMYRYLPAKFVLLQLIGVWVFCTIILVGIGMLVRKCVPKVFETLNGGR
jgi:hypothetical protein